VRGTQAREGEPVQLAVVTERLHFFDLETGDGIYDGGAVEPVLGAAATSASRA
jgi:hypothetical protein